jgi:bla regulator protein BlaR1
VGATAAMDALPFAVIAKAPVPDDAVAGWNGAVWNGLDIDTMRKMLRTLLQERFHLETHYEDRPVTGYELLATKPKLHRADPANRAGCKEGPGTDRKDPRLTNPAASRLVTCRNMTLTQFAAQLNNELFGMPPVVDSTGLVGRYDFTINFSPSSALPNGPAPGAPGDAAAAEPNGAISLAEALSGQLGLKLQSRKVMAPVLVIDHVNTAPTGN